MKNIQMKTGHKFIPWIFSYKQAVAMMLFSLFFFFCFLLFFTSSFTGCYDLSLNWKMMNLTWKWLKLATKWNGLMNGIYEQLLIKDEKFVFETLNKNFFRHSDMQQNDWMLWNFVHFSKIEFNVKYKNFNFHFVFRLQPAHSSSNVSAARQHVYNFHNMSQKIDAE